MQNLNKITENQLFTQRLTTAVERNAMKVPFFPYPELYLEDHKRYLEIINNTLSKGAFIMQDELQEFESNLANYLGCKFAFGVADGTAALEMSLECAGIKQGDEVILSTHTFIATAAAVQQMGGVPILADCQSDSQIDIDSVKRCISDKTKVIMPTQLNGRTCNMDGLIEIASDYGLQIIEDSCQGLGAKYRGQFAGLFGIVGSYSFYPAKTLGCFGDGGAIVTNDSKIAEKIEQLRDHGRRKSDGKVTMFGRNGRLDNVQAAILNHKLKKFDKNIKRRREIAELYSDRLSDVHEIHLPVGPAQDLLRFDTFQNYEVRVEERDKLKKFLASRDVATIIQWGGWMLHQFDKLGLKSDVVFGEQMSKQNLLLPMNHILSNDQVEYTCEMIKKFYR